MQDAGSGTMQTSRQAVEIVRLGIASSSALLCAGRQVCSSIRPFADRSCRLAGRKKTQTPKRSMNLQVIADCTPAQRSITYELNFKTASNSATCRRMKLPSRWGLGEYLLDSARRKRVRDRQGACLRCLRANS